MTLTHRLGMPELAPLVEPLAVFIDEAVGSDNGRWAMLHRPMPAAGLAGAPIWLSWSPDLKHWGDHHILLRARRGGWWDANRSACRRRP